MREVSNQSFPSPNIIGGTGGSGTRVVARILRRAGMFVGENLNASEDAIDFGEFSDRWINSFLKDAHFAAQPSSFEPMMGDLQSVLTRHCGSMRELQLWGWKEPRSIFLLPFFHQVFPSLKFLHVIRDGRDMAYSHNQNQLQKHGHAVLRFTERLRSEPSRSMILWNRVNMAAASFGKHKLHCNYLLLRFEDLCFEPVVNIRRVFNFLGLRGNVEEIAREEVVPPTSLGRWRERSRGEVLRLQRVGEQALREFGYHDAKQ